MGPDTILSVGTIYEQRFELPQGDCQKSRNFLGVFRWYKALCISDKKMSNEVTGNFALVFVVVVVVLVVDGLKTYLKFFKIRRSLFHEFPSSDPWIQEKQAPHVDKRDCVNLIHEPFGSFVQQGVGFEKTGQYSCFYRLAFIDTVSQLLL